MYINGGGMRKVTFTEFRKDASALFSAVENGEKIQILRHGKPIAEILPFKNSANHLPSWKKRKIRHSIKGEELSSLILSEREQTS
jgi:antitoxin (DNA-binding transcriptional repressor) of toxin-antitoxin stability system